LQWYTEGAGDELAGDELAHGVVHMVHMVHMVHRGDVLDVLDVLDVWWPRQVGQLLTLSAANHMRR